jgi:hypothetical protein
MEHERINEAAMNPMKWKYEPNSKEGYNAESQPYKAKNGKTYMIYRVGLDPGKGSTTVFKVKGDKKHHKNLADLLKHLDAMKESVELDEGAVKDAIMNFFESLPKASHAELLKAAKAKDRGAVAAALKKHKVKPVGGMARNEKEMVDLIIDWWPDMYDMFEETEVSGDEISEKVDLDARTGPYRRTVERLSYQRAMRESKLKGKKWDGLYNDGSGKGASIPEPIDFNKESRRYEKEVDGRVRAFKEAMRRVEMYRKLRESKKKTIMGSSVKESISEAADMITKSGIEMIGNSYAIAEADLSPAQKKYREFFEKALKKFGADSPADMDDAQKKKFFNYIKANYKESADILPPHGRTLDEEELSKKQKEYRAFFDKALEKFGAESPAKMDDAQKKKFFNYVKANWKG